MTKRRATTKQVVSRLPSSGTSAGTENGEDTENPDTGERIKALEALLGYLGSHHAHQMASFTLVDRKVSVRLTICGGLAVVLLMLLPNLLRAEWPFPLFAVGAAALFFVPLARTLWLMLLAIEVASAPPPVSPGDFIKVARNPKPDVAQVFEGLVVSYVNAISANQKELRERDARGNKLVFWSKLTFVCSCIAGTVLVGVSLGAIPMPKSEVEVVRKMGKESTNSGGGNQGQQTGQTGGSQGGDSGNTSQPSLAQPAKLEPMGKSADFPKGGSSLPRPVNPAAANKK